MAAGGTGLLDAVGLAARLRRARADLPARPRAGRPRRELLPHLPPPQRVHRLPRRRRQAARHPPVRLRLAARRSTRAATRPTARRATACRRSASAATSAPGVAADPRAGCPGARPNNPFGTGTGLKSFHPPGWARDAAGAVIATPRPSSHSLQAKRNIRTCVSCHREESCLACHSTDPTRGPDSRPTAPASVAQPAAGSWRPATSAPASSATPSGRLELDCDDPNAACARATFSRDFRAGVIIEAWFRCLIACLALPADGLATEPASGIFDPVAARAEHLAPGEPRVLSKKEEWLREKALRPDVHISDADLARAVDTQSRAREARARAKPRGAPRASPSRRPSGRAHRAGDDAVQRLDARGAADPARAGARRCRAASTCSCAITSPTRRRTWTRASSTC